MWAHKEGFYMQVHLSGLAVLKRHMIFTCDPTIRRFRVHTRVFWDILVLLNTIYQSFACSVEWPARYKSYKLSTIHVA